MELEIIIFMKLLAGVSSVTQFHCIVHSHSFSRRLPALLLVLNNDYS